MRTNLSKFTVAFSDSAWDVDPDSGGSNCLVGEINGGNGVKKDEFVGMFPLAWQVGNYLTRYSKKYIPDGTILFNSNVIRIEKSDDRTGSWLVSWSKQKTGGGNTKDSKADCPQSPQSNDNFNGDEQVISDRFDKVVVALGFFSKPQRANIPGLTTDFPGKVLHSTQLDMLNDILGDNAKNLTSQGERAKIVVIGGSLSGAEVAASLAMQLSNAEHSPNSPSIENFSQYEIVHVASRSFWALPPFLPTNPIRRRVGEQGGTSSGPNPSPTFLPLDLCFYDLSKRLPDPVEELPAIPTKERSKISNEYFEMLVGGDQSELGDGSLGVRKEDFEKPTWVAISGEYSEFVRSGTIKVIKGRVTSAGTNNRGDGTLIVSPLASKGQSEISLVNVVGVVAATGFAPYDFQTILPENVCKSLQYDPADSFLPLVLGKHGTLHHEFPDIGFVGMYRGPYWGVMEMQSRYLAALWAEDRHCEGSLMHNHDGLQRMQELRNAKAARGQWPMGDYVGIMESFAREMKMKRQSIDGMVGGHNTVVAARYIPADTNQTSDSDAAKIMQSLSSTLHDASSHHFLARATFRALQGTWRLLRILASKIPSLPSGTFTGNASFHPRLPTAPGYDAEYLYIEEGTFVCSTGAQLPSTRRYVYRYSELDNKLSVWFVKTDDSKSVDCFFHSLEFIFTSNKFPSEEGTGWKAKGNHLCSEDNYEAQYDFRFRGIGIEKFGIKYLVNGPKKDYIADASYERSSLHSRGDHSRL